ncbi:MAG: glycosyltransferase family 39 protein [Magnetovibrio sp.]|nr:glycosyltransferase family 39 protein [Magnetovibrio sp.]
MSAPRTAIAGLLERNAALITDPRRFTLFVVAVLAALGGLRVALFPGFGGDDGEQLVFSQYLDWGYQTRNPPLFTWVLVGVQKFLGPTVLSVVALRMAVLAATYLLIMRIGRMILPDARLAPLAAGALLTIFYVAWNTIHGFNHSVSVTFFYAAALWIVLRLDADPAWRDYALFGLIAGLGVITKYSFAVFLAALLAAALMDSGYRRRLLDPRTLLALAIAAAVIWPQFAWYLDHFQPGLVAGENELSWSENAKRAAKGLFRLAVAAFAFLLPLAVIGLAIFWPSLRRPARHSPTRHRHLRLIERTAVLIFVAAAVGIVIIKGDRVRTHYMFFLALFPLYFFLRYGTRIDGRQIRLFAATVTLSGITLVGALVGKFAIEPLVCNHCEDQIPYGGFADQLRGAGFEQGTVVAYFHRDPLPGNLRAQFPDSRIVSAKHPEVIAPVRHAPGQCLIIWPVIGATDPKTATLRSLRLVLGVRISDDHPSKVLRANLSPYGDRPHELEYILLTPGRGRCR